MKPFDAPASEAPAPSMMPFIIERPASRTLPLVVASPHSGRAYPESFVAASRLDPMTLRRSEDSFIEELFGDAPALGAPLIHATFPRAFLDLNREPFELDPKVVAGPLPHWATTRSPRIAAGLGTIARVVATGYEIYRQPITLEEALGRIRTFYKPYHTALSGLIEETVTRFGRCILVDAHSMPTVALDDEEDPLADIVIGDCHGRACSHLLTQHLQEEARRLGFTVARNIPYSGGYTTRHYGRPARGIHAIQIEVKRSLYMDESTMSRRHDFKDVRDAIRRLLASIDLTAV